MTQVSNTPVLVLIDKDGNRLTLSGAEALAKDPECKDFPWKDYSHVEDNTLAGDGKGMVVLVLLWIFGLYFRDFFFHWVWGNVS